MDYFDKQDSKSKSHDNCNQNKQEPYLIAKNVFPDNWKVPQDGDFDFVSKSWPRFLPSPSGFLPVEKMSSWLAQMVKVLAACADWDLQQGRSRVKFGLCRWVTDR